MSKVPSRSLLVLAVLVSLPVSSASADDASPWLKDGHAAVRLLAGSRSGAMMLGGIAFQLDPGWKTYWRSPGDSGVPPRFDFSKSDNVDAVTVLWPAPHMFDDGAGGHSLGFKGQLVLPLRIVAKSPDKPVTLRADISYAVCDKICIPVEASLELGFTGIASTQDATLRTALDAVPKPASIGDTSAVTIRDVKRDGNFVIVDVTAPESATLNLFVEGPTPDWALPIPTLRRDGPPGVKRFAFEIDGVPSGVKPDGAALKLTLVGGDTAAEFNVSLP